MSLPRTRADREYEKFVETDNLETAVRTLVANQISGSFSPSGLTIGGEITTIDVSTTAVALPSTALTDRNAIAIRNLSDTTPLWIGFDTNIQANQNVGSTAGWLVGAQENIQFDVTDSIIIYGISTETIRVQIMELA